MERVLGSAVGWKNHSEGGAGAPARAVLPVYDILTDGAGPGLAYKITDAPAQSIIIRGKGLTGITGVDVSRDVRVGGNGGPAPVVGIVFVADAAITVNLDGTGTNNQDEWGIILSDADGNVYGAPSPLKIFVGE